MECKEFLARFSDYVDGRAEAGVARAIEAHRDTCQQCRHYSTTLEAGRELLRSLPPLDVPEDFRPRLHHRILHVEDGRSIQRQSSNSGATIASVLAVATLVATAAWAPVLGHGSPTVDLPPVVVEAPPEATFTPPRSTPTFPGNMSLFSTTEFQDGIWGDPHDLLREYSPILERRREQALIRVGIE